MMFLSEAGWQLHVWWEAVNTLESETSWHWYSFNFECVFARMKFPLEVLSIFWMIRNLLYFQLLYNEFNLPLEENEGNAKKTVVINYRDGIRRRLHHLKNSENFDMIKAELDMLNYTLLSQEVNDRLYEAARKTNAKTATEQAARLQSLLRFIAAQGIINKEGVLFVRRRLAVKLALVVTFSACSKLFKIPWRENLFKTGRELLMHESPSMLLRYRLVLDELRHQLMPE